VSSAAAMAEELPDASGPVRPAALRLVRQPQRRHALALVPLSEVERAELLRDEAELRAAGLLERPRTRADCIDGPRPCPWIGCRAHLYATILPSGAIKPDHPDLEVWEMAETCSLDLADEHSEGMEANEIAELLGVTDSSIRLHLNSGLVKLKRGLGRGLPNVPAAASPEVVAEPEQVTPAATAPTPEQTETIDVQQESYQPETAPHPGVVLRRYIVEGGLSQGRLARQLGRSPALINHIISGRNPMTASTAWMLSRVFGTEPRFWMDLQVAYDLARTRPGVSLAAGAGSTPAAARAATTGEHQ
jgi:addiction module HigA family antidote